MWVRGNNVNMLAKNTQHQADLPDQPDFIELLSRLDGVGQEQIDLFRSQLPTEALLTGNRRYVDIVHSRMG